MLENEAFFNDHSHSRSFTQCEFLLQRLIFYYDYVCGGDVKNVQSIKMKQDYNLFELVVTVIIRNLDKFILNGDKFAVASRHW